MLSPEALDQIKQTAKPKPQIIHIEIGNGFVYSSVMIGSIDNQQVIQDISNDLGWDFKSGGTITDLPHLLYRTEQKFENGTTAINIANIIKTDLESKGFEIKSKTKAYR